MYVALVVLSIAGDHVPVIPFVEEDGKVNVPPEQMGAIGLNVGVVDGFTIIVCTSGNTQLPLA